MFNQSPLQFWFRQAPFIEQSLQDGFLSILPERGLVMGIVQRRRFGYGNEECRFSPAKLLRLLSQVHLRCRKNPERLIAKGNPVEILFENLRFGQGMLETNGLPRFQNFEEPDSRGMVDISNNLLGDR